MTVLDSLPAPPSLGARSHCCCPCCCCCGDTHCGDTHSSPRSCIYDRAPDAPPRAQRLPEHTRKQLKLIQALRDLPDDADGRQYTKVSSLFEQFCMTHPCVPKDTQALWKLYVAGRDYSHEALESQSIGPAVYFFNPLVHMVRREPGRAPGRLCNAPGPRLRCWRMQGPTVAPVGTVSPIHAYRAVFCFRRWGCHMRTWGTSKRCRR